MRRHRQEHKSTSAITTRSLSSPALPISSKLLNVSERVLSVRPLTLLLDFVVAPTIERLALVEDAFTSLPIVRSLEGYGISSGWASFITLLLAGAQLRRALRRQRDLTLLLLATAWPIWRTINTPASSAKPRRVEAFWVVFALLQGFEATRVHPHPLLAAEEPLSPSPTLSQRLRPLMRVLVHVRRALEQRILNRDPSSLPYTPSRPGSFPEPLPHYISSSYTSTSTPHLPRLALSLRTFGTSWPVIKLLLLWLISLDDFALANRLLSPFRSPRPKPPGRRVVTVITVQDPEPLLPTSRAGTAPPSPPRTPDLERDNGYIVPNAAASHSVHELGDAHGVWAKPYHLGEDVTVQEI